MLRMVARKKGKAGPWVMTVTSIHGRRENMKTRPAFVRVFPGAAWPGHELAASLVTFSAPSASSIGMK